MIFGLLQSCLLTTITTVPVNHRFVRYRLAQDGIPKIGLVDKEELNVAEVLGYADLFKLIEAHPSLAGDYKFTTGEVSPLKSVEILAPLLGAISYIAHAAEFHKSGFDSSDKNEQPDFPWGAVIINDVTARERQRDHKQFYIGKSLDTFCPMGPYVVPSSSLIVNGEVRQSQNTSELIFDVPTLIQTASMGISVQPGDIIATGTPVGVGMGMSPNVWLKDGDVVEISIPPLGTLANPVTSTSPGVSSLFNE
ncbi:putative fumarylacetoacetate hydrolase [Mycena olivaceomarginata]|nr:putative fumarylacetoacetate hydrolase [Mycena olivaceomarginata]